jgi:hypothetical protein
MRVFFLAVLLLAACGRSHTLADSTYTFTETGVLRDDCGLAGQGVLGSGALITTGDLANLTLSKPAGKLVGLYRYALEEMVLDGTFTNQQALVRGQTCLIDTVSIHLTTTTVDAAHFTGTVAIDYDTSLQPETCTCRFWFTVSGARAP